ncbi:MAG: class I SAM-dependent methyltransferase [Acidobacteria bacterium]|nr:class I SAM-dependent methyltransferase [Acidobacteriota bacterium]
MPETAECARRGKGDAESNLSAVVTSRMLFDGLELTTGVADLGDADPAWAGIYSPRYSDATVARYIHGQFLEDAGVYLARYQATPYWMSLLTEAQQHFSLVEREGPLRILDLGSGGGNTVVPLLDLYPDAELVASDLSLPLLKALRATLAERYPKRRVPVLQQNAERLLFAPRQFHLVVGGAILHHLRSPARTIAESARILRPGGVAIFFEPFASGNRLVAAVFQALLDLDGGRAPRRSGALPRELRSFLAAASRLPAASQRLSPELARTLDGFCRDISVRSNMNWLTVRLRRRDDKWLFDREFFAAAARRVGFCEPAIFGLTNRPKRFAEHIRAIVRLALGPNEGAFPPWAAEIIDAIDECLTPETRRETLIEAGVVLVKS